MIENIYIFSVINTCMAIELKLTTYVRAGCIAVLNEEVNPIIDFDNIRYLFDVETFYQYGGLIWTRFDLTTQLPLDETSFTRHYAAHNVFHELILGTNIGTLRLQTETFPSFPVPDDLGSVTP